MFGDMGHGLILLLFALYMVICEEKIIAMKSKSEIANIFFGGRYIILLMGIFSMYTGFVYNDVFSLSMNIFGSSWKIGYNFSTVEGQDSLQLNPTTDYIQEPYFIGMDPIWQVRSAHFALELVLLNYGIVFQTASNKIIFLNSFKMKLSIIFGVVHMIFGVCVSVANFV